MTKRKKKTNLIHSYDLHPVFKSEQLTAGSVLIWIENTAAHEHLKQLLFYTFPMITLQVNNHNAPTLQSKMILKTGSISSSSHTFQSIALLHFSHYAAHFLYTALVSQKPEAEKYQGRLMFCRDQIPPAQKGFTLDSQ